MTVVDHNRKINTVSLQFVTILSFDELVTNSYVVEHSHLYVFRTICLRPIDG